MSYTSTDWLKFLGTACIGMSIIWAYPSQANITPDSTLPNNSTVNIQGNTTLIEAGTRAGNNLFHSFKEFSIPTAAEAHFNNSVDINNIITRVTGGRISNIDGLIKANGSANLFLINPSGIVFGENGRLDIGGSFVGSTADAIGFDENNLFSASNPENNSSLLQINPNALFFNQLQTASIENSSVVDVRLNSSDEYQKRGLRVPDGKSLLFVGGDVNMNGGGLVAPGGRVELGGLAGKGTVGLNVDGDNLSLNFPSGVETSDVTLSNAAGVRVAGDSAGSVAVNAKNLEMTEESFLFTRINEGGGSQQSKTGNIDINVTDAINVNESDIFNQESAKGNAGNLTIKTTNLLIENGGKVSTAGNLNIEAQDIQVIGASKDNTRSQLSAVGDNDSTQDNSRNLNIKTNTLLVKDGAEVVAGTFGNPQSTDSSSSGDKKSKKKKESRGTKEKDISGKDDSTTKINPLSVQDEALENSSTDIGENQGNLTINAQVITVTGNFKDGKKNILSILSTSTKENGTRKGGDLNITTRELYMSDGGKFQVEGGNGQGGDININTSILQLERATISATNKSQDIGSAGNITIIADSIHLNNESKIDADSEAAEVAFAPEKEEQASINITSKYLIMRDNSEIEAEERANLEEGTVTTVTGGNVTINTDILVALDNSDIRGDSENNLGGNVTIEAQGIFGAQVRSQPTLKSDITASGKNFAPDNAGDIKTNTPDFDFDSGLITLATIPVETEVAEACAAGGSIAQSRFEIIGRGGLASLPTDTLSADAVQVDLVSIKPEINKPVNTNVSTKPKTSTPKKIVEATGWVQNNKGEIFFVADAANQKQVNNWYNKNNF